MATLYELTGQMLFLQRLVEDPETDPKTIEDTMEALDYEIEEKANGYAKILTGLKAQVAVVDEEIKRLQTRKSCVQNNIDRMKQSLEDSMRATGKTKFRTDLFSFGIQKNPPTVEIIDVELIPSLYLIPQDPKVDKKSILAYIKEHGDTEYAKLTQGESLRIR